MVGLIKKIIYVLRLCPFLSHSCSLVCNGNVKHISNNSLQLMFVFICSTFTLILFLILSLYLTPERFFLLLQLNKILNLIARQQLQNSLELYGRMKHCVQTSNICTVVYMCVCLRNTMSYIDGALK